MKCWCFRPLFCTMKVELGWGQLDKEHDISVYPYVLAARNMILMSTLCFGGKEHDIDVYPCFDRKEHDIDVHPYLLAAKNMILISIPMFLAAKNMILMSTPMFWRQRT